MELSNSEVAKKLREISAAYILKNGGIFQIRAYESAATSIEHLTSEVKDLWGEGKLDQIPGIGESIAAHLKEFFETGKVAHWEDIKKGIPEGAFKILDVPGIGPKTALKLAKMGVKDEDDLESKLRSGELIKKGLSKKLSQRITQGLKGAVNIKSGRMLLPYAFTQAEKVLDYLKKSPDVSRVDVLGSLRRMVATIGDLDFAVATQNPQKIVEHIISMPGISGIIGKGEAKVTMNLAGGLQADFRVAEPNSYGALLQYFTGSKSHNIHLRIIAEHKGLSLSEYGIKNMKTGKLHQTPTEKELYNLLGMEVPPPEIREDAGEIEAGLEHKLPNLIKLEDVKGDLHIHSDLITNTSHDSGFNSVKEIIEKAKDLGYSFIGISDHQPSQKNHNKEQMIKVLQERKKLIEHINYSQKSVRVLNLLEVDILPDGSLGVPDEALKFLDFALAGIHSGHHMSKDKMTKRILKALENPYVKILTHPTNRLLNERGSSEVDWTQIFKYASENNKALEINAYPNRLDLPDTLVREAKSYGVRFTLGTDSHHIDSMGNMKFGVAVARRGWATKEDILNTWDFKKLTEWFMID